MRSKLKLNFNQEKRFKYNGVNLQGQEVQTFNMPGDKPKSNLSQKDKF